MVENQLPQENIKILLSQLNDSDIATQKSAIYHLGSIKADSAIPHLAAILNKNHANADLRLLIVESLAKMDSSTIVEPLISCLENEAENFNVRRAVIKALGENLEYKKTLLTLLRFADDERRDIFLRQQVKYAITENFYKVILAEQELQKQKAWLETLFNPDFVDTEKVLLSNTRNYSKQSLTFSNYVRKARTICLNNHELFLTINCEIKDEHKVILFLEVLPQPNKEIKILPPGLKIEFLSPNEKILKATKTKEADNRIGLPVLIKIKQLQISQKANKPFRIRISEDNYHYTENFPSQ